MNMTLSQKGVYGSIIFLGILCSSHLFGYLADTKGRHRIIQPTLFIASLISFTGSFVQNFNIFVTLRFLNGFL